MLEQRIKFRLTTKTISLTLLGLILLLIYFLPLEILYNESGSYCIHQNLLGFGCPGCGMTRAIHSFLHFNLAQAASLNYAVFGLFPFLIMQTIFLLTYNELFRSLRNISAYIFIALLASIYFFRIIDFITV